MFVLREVRRAQVFPKATKIRKTVPDQKCKLLINQMDAEIELNIIYEIHRHLISIYLLNFLCI